MEKMSLPDLTICIMTYKRPYYAIHCMEGFTSRFRYDGKIKFHIADGGSDEKDFQLYAAILKDYDVTVSKTNNLASMVNACAKNSGEYWICTVDDFIIDFSTIWDASPDVRFLMANPEVGKIRMGRLAFWEGKNYAELVNCGGLHWWVLDDARSTASYRDTIGFSLYHRRFWDWYGDVPPCEEHMAGNAELNMESRYRAKPGGPKIAIPMRFGENGPERKEPILHIGVLRPDEYAKESGSPWCAR
jgi:hypothetical protein